MRRDEEERRSQSACSETVFHDDAATNKKCFLQKPAVSSSPHFLSAGWRAGGALRSFESPVRTGGEDRRNLSLTCGCCCGPSVCCYTLLPL